MNEKLVTISLSEMCPRIVHYTFSNLYVISLFLAYSEFISYPFYYLRGKMDEIGSLLCSCQHLGCWAAGVLGHCNITNVANFYCFFMSKCNIFKIFPSITSTLVWWERYLELFFRWYFPAACVEQQCSVFQQIKQSCRVTSKAITQTIIFTLVSIS